MKYINSNKLILVYNIKIVNKKVKVNPKYLTKSSWTSAKAVPAELSTWVRFALAI